MAAEQATGTSDDLHTTGGDEDMNSRNGCEILSHEMNNVPTRIAR